MKVRGTIAVEFDITDDPDRRFDAYGTMDDDEVRLQELAFMRGDEGQGDYLTVLLTMDDVKVDVVSLERIPE